MTKDLWLGYQGDKRFTIPLANLRKHAIALGSSGSGKTVFTKILIEECALHGVPSLIFDVQGDLCSLALFGEETKKHDLPDEQLQVLKKEIDVTIYTPVSSKGITLCINPLDLPKANLPQEESITLIHDTATALTKLLGLSLRVNKGKYAQAVLYSTLFYSYQQGISIGTFEELIALLRDPPQGLQEEISEFLAETKNLELLIKQLKYLTIGQKKLLFQFGVPSDIDRFFGRGKQGTALSIIYLNTLGSQEEKEYYVARIANQLYQWMLDNPSESVQGLFVLDEIAPFIPAGSEKPVCKPMLKLLFKQARKYGIGCVIATQNPGDIDYKAFSQFGTWAIGRLNLRQDIKKVQQALKSLTSDLPLETTLPKLKTGEFFLYAPDSFDSLQRFRTRWLFTDHKTLTENHINELMSGKKPRFASERVEKARPEKSVHKPVNMEEENEQSPKSEQQATPARKTGSLLVAGIGEDAILTKALRKRKRRFGFFGEFETQLLHLQEDHRPALLARVRRIRRWMGGLIKTKRQFLVLFDGSDGSIIRIKKGSYQRFPSVGKLLELSDTELTIAQPLHTSKENYHTKEELYDSTELAKQTVTKTLQSLEKKGVAAHEKIGKFRRWIGALPLKRQGIEGFASTISLAESEQKVSVKVDDGSVRDFISIWFPSSSVVELQPVLLPQYVANYSRGKKTETLRFDGVTGKVIR